MKANFNVIQNDGIYGISQSDAYIKDMLSFFQYGWNDRGSDDQKRVRKIFQSNMARTFNGINQVGIGLKALNIPTKSAYIKAESVFSQEVLIAIAESDYLRDDFLKIYDVTNKIEAISKLENHIVNFAFLYDNGSINQETLSSDGYVLLQPLN